MLMTNLLLISTLNANQNKQTTDIREEKVHNLYIDNRVLFCNL